jgi:hypothetical protein
MSAEVDRWLLQRERGFLSSDDGLAMAGVRKPFPRRRRSGSNLPEESVAMEQKSASSGHYVRVHQAVGPESG